MHYSKYALFGLILLLLQGCKPANNSQEQVKQVKGVATPFYSTSTFAIDLLDSSGQWRNQSAKQFYGIHLSLFKGLLDGELTGYRSSKMAKAYELDKLKSRARLRGYETPDASLGNENFKQNFIDNIDKKRFLQYQVTVKWGWSINQNEFQLSLHSLKPIYEPSVGGISAGKQPLCAIAFDDAMGHLSRSNQNMLFTQIRDRIFHLVAYSQKLERPLETQMQSQNSGISIIKRCLPFRNQFDSLHQHNKDRFFKQIHLDIYQHALDGSIGGYPTDSLEQSLSDSAIKKQGATEEVVKYSPDPSDYSYKRDTLLYDHLDPESIQRYRIIENWESNGQEGFTIQPRALAMAYRGERGNVLLPPMALFWMKTDRINDVLSPDKANWLKKFLFLRLQQRLATQGYDF